MLLNQDKLLQAILSIASLANRFQNVRYVPANDADYDIVHEVFKAIGQDEFLH